MLYVGSKIRFFIIASILAITFFITPHTSQAANESPQGVFFQGRLMDATGTTALVDSTTELIVRILDHNQQCILYEEQYTGGNTLNITDGTFAIKIGTDGITTVAAPGGSMARVFANEATAITGLSGTGCGGTYTPSAGDIRYIELTVNGTTLTPNLAIYSVPQALSAETINGLESTDFVQVTGTVTQALMEGLVDGSSATGLHTHSEYVNVTDTSQTLNSSFNINGTLGIGGAPSANFQVTNSAGTEIGAIVKGAAGQSVDLMQWRDSADTVVARVDASGNLYANGQNLTGVVLADGTVPMTGTLTISTNNAASLSSTSTLASGKGVEGVAADGYGIYGTSTNSYGVLGTTSVGIGGHFSNTGAGTNPVLVSQKSATSTTASLFEGQDSGGTALFTVENKGNLMFTGIATASAPAVSAAGTGRMYFDSTLNKFQISENGGAYADIGSGGGGSYVADTGDTMTGTLTINSGSGAAIAATGATGQVGIGGASDTNIGVAGSSTSGVGISGQSSTSSAATFTVSGSTTSPVVSATAGTGAGPLYSGIDNGANTVFTVSNTGSITMFEPVGSGSDSYNISVPALAGDLNWVLPTTAGTSGQFLQTNGSGTLTWASGGGGMTDPMTTDGDIIYQNSSAPARLPVGSNDQALIVSSGAPAWGQIPTGGIADNAVSVAKMADGTDGGLITYDAAGAAIELAPGTSGQFLKSNGAGVALSWDTPSSTPGTDTVTVAMMADGTDGSLITYDATGAAIELTPGTSGQFLKSNGAGAALTWDTPSSTPGNDTVTVAMMADGTDGALITYDATGAAVELAPGTAEYVLTSNGAGAALSYSQRVKNSGDSMTGTLTIVSASGAAISATGATGQVGVGGMSDTSIGVAGSSTSGTGVAGNSATGSAGAFTVSGSTTNPVVSAKAGSGGGALFQGIDNSSNTVFELTNTGSLNLYEPVGSGSDKYIISAPAIGSDLNFVLPATAGTSGQFLQTNGSGTLTWATASGGGGSYLPLDGSSAMTGAIDLDGNNLTDVGTLGFASSGGTITTAVADGASAIGVTLNTTATYSTAGAKLASFQNNGSEKSYIDYEGAIMAYGLDVPVTGGTTGVPVYINGNGTVADADADAVTTAIAIGVKSATGTVRVSGIYCNAAAWDFAGDSSAAGTPYYLAVGGGITKTPPTASGDVVMRVGIVYNQASDCLLIAQGEPIVN